MKKIVIALAMLFTITTATMASTNNVETSANVEAYKFNINLNSLTRALKLKLSKDKQDQYTEIMKEFERNMDVAVTMPTEKRKLNYAKNTVIANLKAMRNLVLDEKQYRTYLMILNTTLYNRGIILTSEEFLS